jgi:hypothetical protein
MRSFLLLLIAGSLVAFVSACSSSSKQTSSNSMQSSVSGILIDQACGAKMMTEDDPEKAASAHPKACAMKDECAASGYAVISGKEMIKFDDNGNKLAKDFLAKTDKTDDLKVTVEGVRTGDTIAVTAINPAG